MTYDEEYLVIALVPVRVSNYQLPRRKIAANFAFT